MMVIFTMIIVLVLALMLASAAGIVSERAGIVNISIEGSMVLGALVYGLLMREGGSFITDLGKNEGTSLFAILIAGSFGLVLSFLLSIPSIKFNSDQIIVGTAINILMPSIALLAIIAETGQSSIPLVEIPTNPSAVMGFNTSIFLSFFLVLAIIGVLWFVLSKTTFGLRLKAAGENPYALETSGVSNNKVRYIALMISGTLSAMAGAIWIQGNNIQFLGSVFGLGFIALGILIFGQWKTPGIIIGSIVMGTTLGLVMTIPTEAPRELLRTIPYIIPIIALIIFKSKGSPSSLGKPFKKDERL